MKTIKFFILALMALPLVFVSCSSDDDTKGPVTYVEDGFYVVGDATSIADLQATDAPKGLMAAGIDENGAGDDEKKQTVRDGMYEKYVALEGGKPFSLMLKAGAQETKYGATLTLSETLAGDDEPAIQVYKGSLTENGTLQVAESGLYHIVLDLNKDGLLSDKLILIAPVEWGVRGAMNNWGFTLLEKPTFNKTTMTYTLRNATVEAAGGFKFAYGNGWKIELNAGGEHLVKANTNLGNDTKEDNLALTEKVAPGGGNIGIERGIYTIELKWTLAKGAIKDGYVAILTKTGDVADVPFDDATVYSLIGSAIDGDTNWGTDLDFTFVSNTNDHVVYQAENAALTAGEFKVRTNHNWDLPNFGFGQITIEGTTLTNGGGNFAIAEDATFSKITFEFDWASQVTNAKLVFVP
jgi:hypothetical protein